MREFDDYNEWQNGIIMLLIIVSGLCGFGIPIIFGPEYLGLGRNEIDDLSNVAYAIATISACFFTEVLFALSKRKWPRPSFWFWTDNAFWGISAKVFVVGFLISVPGVILIFLPVPSWLHLSIALLMGLLGFFKWAEKNQNLETDRYNLLMEPKVLEWRRKAELGEQFAQLNLGVIYAHGDGVTQDYKEAVKWLRMASEQGDAEAQARLGYMYANGKGAAQDYKEAVKWYRMAAKQGYAEAQNYLGGMYANGKGVAQDYILAYMWIDLSVRNGNAEAVKARVMVIEKMTFPQIKEARKMSGLVKPRNKPIKAKQPSETVKSRGEL